jgi:serine protease
MTYHGGSVVTGAPKVYLVFWGSQWGTASTDTSGYQEFSGDPAGMAPVLQAFFAGLGSNNERWSTIATQYCSGVASGAKSCPSSAPAVQYANTNVLGGVWEDTSFTPPTGPPASATTPVITAAQIAQEASNAEGYFGDPSPDSQYVIVSPTGTNPDGWADPSTGFCAYHSATGSMGITGPDVAYTNLPYVPDAGTGCGTGFVNSPGALDGVTLTAGHEYVETLTDPGVGGFGGWWDKKGWEIGDKCDWLAPTQPGAASDLALATGNFAVQGMWANDNTKRGGCDAVHTAIALLNPGKQTSVLGAPVNVQIGAHDVASGATLTYGALNLPASLSIDPSTGLISGSPTTRGAKTVTVTVTDSGASSAAVTFKWMITR